MASPAALVVEDAPEFARLTARLLESEGFAVTVVADGARAVDVARRLSPELVVLDVTLPGLDGIEVCRRLDRLVSARGGRAGARPRPPGRRPSRRAPGRAAAPSSGVR